MGGGRFSPKAKMFSSYEDLKENGNPKIVIGYIWG